LPHKVAVVPLLDELSPAATLMGAVNCAQRIESRLVGEHTDGKRFLTSLQDVTDPAGKRTGLLGAGGAARAIAVELGLGGAAHITIVNRSLERGEALAKLLNEQLQAPAELVEWKGNYAIPADCDVLIDATSIGLGDPSARVPI